MSTQAATITGLDKEELLATARAQTGLSDFGDPDIHEPLDILIDALNSEAQLTPAGILAKKAGYGRVLANRLRIQDALKRHPEILDEEIAGPIVVVGLPRSGTTKMHRMIAADPGLQKLILWKMFYPAPLDGETPGDPSQRIVMAQAAVKAMQDASPAFNAAHPMDALEADEEVMMLELTFLGYLNAMSAQVPSYAKWVGEQSFDRWYKYLRMMLQFLQFHDGSPKKPWLLKGPAHLGNLPLLFKYFPNATIVHCHRDPVTTIPSIAALSGVARRMSSEMNTDKELGQLIMRIWGGFMANCDRDRPALEKAHKFIDVSYPDIVGNAPALIEKVYAAAGIPLTDEARRAMAAWDHENTQHKHGRHTYDLEQFGYTRAGLEQDFAAYRERYGHLF